MLRFGKSKVGNNGRSLGSRTSALEAGSLLRSGVAKRHKDALAGTHEPIDSSKRANFPSDGNLGTQPLLNPLIADAVGEYLSEADLKSCRSVSHDWYKWSSPQFRKKTTLYIKTLNDVEKLVKHPDENYASSPHKHVVFKIKKMVGKKMIRHMESFWNLHSNGLTSLTLKGVEECEWEIFIDIFYRRTPSLTKLAIYRSFDGMQFSEVCDNFSNTAASQAKTRLSTLKIHGLFNRFFCNAFMHDFIVWILEKCPHLTALELNECHTGNILERHPKPFGYHCLSSVLSTLVDVRRNDPSKIYNIRKLDIAELGNQDEGQIGLPFLKTLEDLQFPLETLTLDFGTSTSVEIAASLVNLYKPTLRKLGAYQQKHADPPRAEEHKSFPFGVCLENLQVLRVSHSLLKSLQFLECVPNLQTLLITPSSDSGSFLSSENTLLATNVVAKIRDRNSVNGFKEKHLMEFRIKYSEFLNGKGWRDFIYLPLDIQNFIQSILPRMKLESADKIDNMFA